MKNLQAKLIFRLCLLRHNSFQLLYNSYMQIVTTLHFNFNTCSNLGKRNYKSVEDDIAINEEQFFTCLQLATFPMLNNFFYKWPWFSGR